MGSGVSAPPTPTPPPAPRGQVAKRRSSKLLMKPLTEKRSLAGHGHGLVFGLSAMQGWRPTMEDAHCAVGAVPGLADHAFFAVFDGHGGSRVAHFLASRMLERVRATNEFAEYAAARARPRLPSAAPRHAGVERLVAAVRVAFAACDAELERGGWAAREGSTANVVFVTPTHVICASAGDTRACLLTRAGASELSSDHRPDTPAETARIRAAGGIVYHRCSHALHRRVGVGEHRQRARAHCPGRSLLRCCRHASTSRVAAVEPTTGTLTTHAAVIAAEKWVSTTACHGLLLLGPQRGCEACSHSQHTGGSSGRATVCNRWSS